jgi:hypothetical protein
MGTYRANEATKLQRKSFTTQLGDTDTKERGERTANQVRFPHPYILTGIFKHKDVKREQQDTDRDAFSRLIEFQTPPFPDPGNLKIQDTSRIATPLESPRSIVGDINPFWGRYGTGRNDDRDER